MKKAVAAAIVVVLVLAAAGAYVWHRAGQELQAGLAAFQASLPPGSTVAYASARPDVFNRSAHLTQVKVVSGIASYTAAVVDVVPEGNTTLRRLTLRDATEHAPGTTMSAALVEADGVALPAVPGGLVAAKATVIDHLDARGIRFVSDSGKDTMAIGQLTVDGYGAGRPANLDVRSVSLESSNVSFDRFTADSLQVRGVDITQMVAPANPVAAFGSGKYGVQWKGLAIVARGKPLITLASLDARVQPEGANKGSASLDIRDLSVLADDQLTPGLRTLGYDRVQATLRADAAFDRSARQIKLDRLDLEAAAMGHLRLAIALDNLPPDLLTPHAASTLRLAMAELIGLQLRSAMASYEDEGLAAKLRAAVASRRGMSEAQVTAGAIGQVRALAAQYGLEDAAIGPVLQFLADPHKLTIGLRPSQPVPVIGIPSLLRNAPEQSLGLQVANQAAGQ